jgi:uncharacterized membrane protein YjdF
MSTGTVQHEKRLSSSWSDWLRYLDVPAVVLIFIIVSINLPYKPYWVITSASAAFLTAVWFYADWRYRVRIPLLIIGFIFLIIQVDALGNYFGLYKNMKEPFPYDELAHFVIPLLSAPVIIWLFSTWLDNYRKALPLGILAVFAVTVSFSISGFYEVVELWDELYFGGKRIWSLYDTSNDLQWDMFGAVLGAALTYAVVRLAHIEIIPHHEHRRRREAS